MSAMTVAMETGERPLRLAIVHSTGFVYPGTVTASYNEARMTPLTTPWQTTLEARIESQSILSRTLLLFGVTALAVALSFGLVLWWVLGRASTKGTA